MMDQRFVVGGVYRRARKLGGWDFGMIVEATIEDSGRTYGLITVGGHAPEPIKSDKMGNWELVAEPGNPLIEVGQKFATPEDMDVAVALRVAEAVRTVTERLVQVEADNVSLRGRVRDLEAAASPPASDKVVDLKARARG